MSSDQYSEKPLPAGKRHCPYCGESIAANASACWLCHEKMAIQAGEPALKARSRSSIHAREETGDSGGWAVFGVLAVILTCSLAFETPGILIALVILAGPAMARALVSASRDTEQPAPAQTPGFILLFFNSLGIAAVVGIASFIAFFATCFVICLGGLGIGALSNAGSDMSLLYCSVTGGVVVGLIVFALLFRQFWPKKGGTG